MKQIRFIFTLLLLLSIQTLFINNCPANCGWYSLNSGTTQGLRSVYFVNSNTGWVVGWGSTVLKTTNGGNNWISQSAYGDFQSVTFIDQFTGWIVGGGPQIYKTTNGGNNWTAKTLPSASLQLIVKFVNNNTGFICGYGGLVLKSTNGGESWVSKNTNTSVNLTGIDFTSPEIGWITGDNGVIKKTTNGGEIWTVQTSGTNTNLGKTDFVSCNNGWISGYGGIVLRTTNGGSNWIINQTPVNSWLTTVYFFNCMTGYAAGGDYNNTACDILKTTTGGESWVRQTAPSTNWLGLIFFASENTGYAVGHEGTILKTVSGGDIVGINNETPRVPSDFVLNQNYPNPFNPVTKISFALPRDYTNVLLKVFDNNGREVSVLINGALSAGTHEVNFDGTRLTSGTYFYRLETKDFNRTKAMMLIK
ncbi:MAG: YCF48-related protein [Ignavibacteriae bacterium]|nr:YCF48-related protein [Ignavibacteriota bacterium]